jgi:hypothetical protein
MNHPHWGIIHDIVKKTMFKSIMQNPKNDKIKMSFFAKRVAFKT